MLRSCTLGLGFIGQATIRFALPLKEILAASSIGQVMAGPGYGVRCCCIQVLA